MSFSDNTNQISSDLIDTCIQYLLHRHPAGLRPINEHFTALRPPSISVQAYIKRIIKYCELSKHLLLAAMFYLEDVFVTDLNIYRLILIAVSLTLKMEQDDHFSSKWMAKVGGIPVSELIQLEIYFLKFKNWNMFISSQNLETIQNRLKIQS